MENNVNCKEMTFVIRNLVYVEDPPRQRRQKFLLMSLEATSIFPQRARDYATQQRQVFPSDMKQRLSNQQENQGTQRNQHLHRDQRNTNNFHGYKKIDLIINSKFIHPNKHTAKTVTSYRSPRDHCIENSARERKPSSQNYGPEGLQRTTHASSERHQWRW